MSDARTLLIDGPAGRLEAALRVAPAPRAAIAIAHPHPLYGGTLHNPVVFHADRELNRVGCTTLRFNFRGVGRSEGTHDEGRAEVGDVAAAAAWVRALAPGRPLLLVGYSFGSQCSVEAALADPSVAGVVAIGLPLTIWPFDGLPRLGRPFGVVQGTRDEYGSIDAVKGAIAAMTPPGRLYPVEGAAHLFPGRAPEAAARVARAVEEILGRA